jgi:hypothetical protein
VPDLELRNWDGKGQFERNKEAVSKNLFIFSGKPFRQFLSRSLGLEGSEIFFVERFIRKIVDLIVGVGKNGVAGEELLGFQGIV